ncbi:MAG: molybdopterin-synthase adenylyltransferase MoeB [Gemmatimonadales bacterium]|nr:molybdopterin-synthase adenylyltransferase MoeB [Gemmatimonadales bacterium]
MTTIAASRGTLSPEELVRYSRHVILPEVGLAGQERLKQARVLVVGCGGLGSPVALYLAAAGVGHLGLVDFDTVDASNLQRQILHGTTTIGRSKLDSAEARLLNLNPHTRIERYETRLNAANALEIIEGYDVVVDGTDNFGTRYLVNDACVLLGVPNAYGSIFRFEGQASVFATAEGPCYRCLFRQPPPPGAVPNCAEGGVLGVLPGLVGTIQATEAIKLILGIGKPLVGELLLVDALDMRFRRVKVRKDPHCPACGTREIKELVEYDQTCAVPAARGVRDLTVAELAARRERGEDFLLLDVREPHEWTIGRIAGAELIPLGEIGRSLDRLPRDREIVVYCKGGVRSAQAAEQLVQAGFGAVTNVVGGITAWSVEIDPSVPRY